tara:strand:+ start:874 stop:1461 length:588 start_codon:yes stop_codon:yes gene_type:complete
MVRRSVIVGKVVNLFASPIYTEEMLFNVDSISKECYRRQKNNSGRVISNVGGYQSESFHLPDPFFNDLFSKVEDAGNALAELIGIAPCKMNNFWININRRGDLNQRHGHPKCQLSGAYYVKVPPNSGLIKFFHPSDRFIVRDWTIREYTPYSSEVWGFEPKENELFIFPSWLDHMVSQNLSNEDRISISFNLMSK